MKTFFWYSKKDRKIMSIPYHAESVNHKTIFDSVYSIWTTRKTADYDIDGIIFTPIYDCYFNSCLTKIKCHILEII